MTITEPTTMLTDYALAALLVVLAARLLRHARNKPTGGGSGGVPLAPRLWAYAFLATGVAALVGGTFHGFREMIPASVFATLRSLTLYAILAASAFFAAGIAAGFRARGLHRVLYAVVLAKAVVFAFVISREAAFRFVIYDYVPALVFVLAVKLGPALRAERGAVWVVAGVLISFAAAGVQWSGFALHTHFNHNDLYHVMEMAAFWCFYRGAITLADGAAS